MIKLSQYLFLIIISALAASAQPKLEIVGGNTYDWKEVKPNNNPLKTVLTIKNTGDESLKITKVKPTCSCTAAPLDKYDLQPGESVAMNVTLRISRSSNYVNKSILIYSNDPENSKKIIRLKAHVIHPIDINDRFMNFGKVKLGDSGFATVKIKNNTNEAVKLYDFKVTPDYVKINVKRNILINPGEEFIIKAEVKPKNRDRIKPKIIFSTNHPDYKTVTIFGDCRVR